MLTLLVLTTIKCNRRESHLSNNMMLDFLFTFNALMQIPTIGIRAMKISLL